MLSLEQQLVLIFLRNSRKEVKFADIFPWAAENEVEHPDVVARSLIDLGLIEADHALGVYRVL